MIFLNISNHHSSLWSEKQTLAAHQYGEIIDLPFPDIDPYWEKEEIELLHLDYLRQIESRTNFIDKKLVTIHIMGEMVFTCLLVTRLLKCGYQVVASTTERKVKWREHQTKEVKFEFVRFRKYVI